LETKTKKKKRYTSSTPAVEQAAIILKYLASGTKIKASLTTISRIVDINKSKTYAILGALQIAGFVTKEKESKLYSLGPDIIPIGQRALKNIDYMDYAKPFLKMLARLTMCTVMFGLIFGQKLIIISKEASGHEFDSNLDIGSSYNIFFKGHGMAILASLPQEEQEKLLAGDNFFQDYELGIIDNSQLRKDIKEVKKKGYALNTGRVSPMIKMLTSAVIGHDDNPIGILIVMGLIKKADISKFGKKLVETARGLSDALGASNGCI
jgi:DNA-binding IclR family transcriptional regulator